MSAPAFMSSPGLSGYCLTNRHGTECPYRACTCTCHPPTSEGQFR